MIFGQEAIKKSGLVPNHVEKFVQIAQLENAFLLFRPVNPMSTSLIASGFGTKGLDIHSKSSDWGPQAGFICVDQTLSKKWGDAKAITQGEKDARHSLSHSNGKVIEMPLLITASRHKELLEKLLYTVVSDDDGLSLVGTRGSEAYDIYLHPVAKLRTVGARFGEETQRLLAAQQPRIATMLTRIPELQQGYLVLYRRSTSQVIPGLSYAAAAARPASTHGARPVMVLGYGSSGVPVTADYDMFAICPHLSRFRAQFNWGRALSAAQGQSKAQAQWGGLNSAAQASLGTVERRTVHENMGRLTAFQRQIKDKMNAAVASPGGHVVHHGTEQDNTQFPERDTDILIISPAGKVGCAQSWTEVQDVGQDMIRLGYTFYSNRAYNAPAGSKTYYPGQTTGPGSGMDISWKPAAGQQLRALTPLMQ